MLDQCGFAVGVHGAATGNDPTSNIHRQFDELPHLLQKLRHLFRIHLAFDDYHAQGLCVLRVVLLVELVQKLQGEHVVLERDGGRDGVVGVEDVASFRRHGFQF